MEFLTVVNIAIKSLAFARIEATTISSVDITHPRRPLLGFLDLSVRSPRAFLYIGTRGDRHAHDVVHIFTDTPFTILRTARLCSNCLGQASRSLGAVHILPERHIARYVLGITRQR